MSRTSTTLTTSLGVLLASMALAIPFGGVASAAGGQTSPGVTVTAVNPADAKVGGGTQIAITAHSERGEVENASCRPRDMNMDCWGSLVLRIPGAGGLSVSKFEVHRVAIGDISCGDHEDGSCDGDHDEGGCDGEDGGCEHGELAVAGRADDGPVQASVNGIAVVRDPGSTGVLAGSKVQLKFVFTDYGTKPYTDEMAIVVNEFVPGSAKPLLYDSGPETIKQVQIHTRGRSG